MISNFRSVLSAILTLLAINSYAQSPVVTYNSPQRFIINRQITPLVPAISDPPIIASGFQNSLGVKVDAAGNVFVADGNSDQVFKIPAGGGPRTVVGSGLGSPYGIALDAAGNIYVADFGAGKLKKILAGTNTTVVIPSADYNLANVAVDAAGNIYTTDLFGSNDIHEFPAGGGAMTTIGSGFNDPQGLAIDAGGNIYVADYGNNAVKKIPAGGGAPITIGTGFNKPIDVAVDAAGNVFVTDSGNEVIKEILAGSGVTITSTSLLRVSFVATDNSGNVYMSDDDNVVRKFKPISSFSMSPALPAGLSFDPNTGIITGTPTTLSTAANYQIIAHYNSGNYTATVNISVISPPPIEAGIPSGSISACAGSPSESPHIVQFPVSDYNLSANIKVTAPPGFEVSVAPDNGYAASLTLVQSGGNINSTIVYVRSVAQPSGNITGQVIISSVGESSVHVAVTAAINALPTAGAVPDQTVLSGQNTADVNFNASGDISWTNNSPGIGLPASGFGNIPGFHTSNTTDSPITATITATPVSAGWVYTANNGANSVSVINTATSTLITTISVPSGSSAITASLDGSRMYVAGINTISIINTATNTVMSTIAVVNPQNIAISPDGTRLYVTSNSTNNVTVINAVNNTMLATIPVGTSPVGIIVSPDGSKVYVANQFSGNTSVISTATNAVIATLPSGQSSFALALSPDGSRLYVTNTGSASAVTIINTATGTIVSSIPVGLFPVGVAVSPDGSRVYTANSGSETVSVIAAATNNVVSTIPVQGAYAISSSLDGSRLFVTTRNSNGAVNAISTSTYKIASTIPIGAFPESIATSLAGAASCDGTPVTFTITVNPRSKNADLANLTVNPGNLTPAFSTTTTGYNVLESNSTANITVTPTTADSTATVTVNGTTVVSGMPSAAIPLNVGNNTITTVVTAQDGTTTKTYTLTVTRAAPGTDNAVLTKLSTNSGVALTQVTGPDYRDYAITVPSTLTGIKITPTTQDAGATVTVNGTSVASGTASPTIPLPFGNTVITTVVTAPDGVTTKTYAITVTRPGSNNAALTKIATNSGVSLTQVTGPDYRDYAITVPNTLTRITVTPTVQDATATVKINGVTVASGTASPAMPLAVGPNVINTVVTAQDGITTKTYSITVTRIGSSNASLANLVTNDGALTPVFSPGTISYTLSVPYSTRNINLTPTVADTTATVTVNGQPVASGATSPPTYLNIGKDTIRTIVKAQDGITTKTYTLIVTRAASDNALLTSIKTTPTETLTSVSGPSYRNYTTLVPNSQSSIQLTSVTQDTTATLKVNGTVVASGKLSLAIPLAVGTNVINTVVTAGDGVTTKTYTITVTRISNNALLTKIATNSGVALTTTTGPDYKDYTINVPNATSSITITPTTQDATATVKVNGTTVASGTASAAIPLQVGANTITTIVTAQDGTTTKTYGITVNRAAVFNLYKPTDSTAADGLTVHPGITPNGDGINDIFTIDGINNYPDNKVTIMGRSGAVVYEAKGYDNQTKFFDGHSNKNGSLQLPGTYFYSLEYKVDGKSKVKTGFLVLKY